jgi:hypothetical protein
MKGRLAQDDGELSASTRSAAEPEVGHSGRDYGQQLENSQLFSYDVQSLTVCARHGS